MVCSTVGTLVAGFIGSAISSSEPYQTGYNSLRGSIAVELDRVVRSSQTLRLHEFKALRENVSNKRVLHDPNYTFSLLAGLYVRLAIDEKSRSGFCVTDACHQLHRIELLPKPAAQIFGTPHVKRRYSTSMISAENIDAGRFGNLIKIRALIDCASVSQLERDRLFPLRVDIERHDSLPDRPDCISGYSTRPIARIAAVTDRHQEQVFWIDS
jgi:hypothetical protein